MAISNAERIIKALKTKRIKKPKIQKAGAKRLKAKKEVKVSRQKQTKQEITKGINNRSRQRLERYYRKLAQRQARRQKARDKQTKQTKKYAKQQAKQIKENREKGQAKAYLTREIKRLKAEKQTMKIKAQIKRLEMHYKNIDTTYKDIREYQAGREKNKEDNIVRIVTNIAEYTEDDSLIIDAEKVLVSKKYEEIEMLRGKGTLLEEIESFPPSQYWHMTEDEQRVLREDFTETVRSFIEQNK